MLKIKVIKKKELSEHSVLVKTNEEELPPKSAGRGTVKTVEKWIADWRKQTEVNTRLALSELARVKLENSIEI